MATIAAREKAMKQEREAKKLLNSLLDESRPEKRRKLGTEHEHEAGNGNENSVQASASNTKSEPGHPRSPVRSMAISSSPILAVTPGRTFDSVLEQSPQEVSTAKLPPVHFPSDIIDLETSSRGAEHRSDEPAVVTVGEEEEESEEEFPELARQAREKAKNALLQKAAALDSRGSISGTNLGSRVISGDQSAHTVAADPVVSILITSDLPNTQPLLVTRTIGQRLKEVRLAWCERQGFPKDLTDVIVLVWAGNRLYDATTCRSLGITLDREGKEVTEGVADTLGEKNRQVHMEAMTIDYFGELKKEKLRRSEAMHTYDDDLEDLAPAQAPEVARLRIILRAKGFQDFKLIVKPTTTISRLIGAFRVGNEVPPDRDIHLMFDGERLEAEATVGDKDLDDLDHIDVYIKKAIIEL